MLKYINIYIFENNERPYIILTLMKTEKDDPYSIQIAYSKFNVMGFLILLHFSGNNSTLDRGCWIKYVIYSVFH